MEYEIILEKQPDGGYTVYVPKLPDVITEGETKEEALKNVQEAISGYLKVINEMGWNPPEIEEAKVEVSAA
jgi:antitoxin HicB